MFPDSLQTISGRKILLDLPDKKTDPWQWIEQRREEVDQHLSTEGILLVRGLNIPDSGTFERVLSDLFGGELLDYTYRSTPRTQIKHSRVYTASEYHQSETIPQHNENAYADSWPLRIGFFCIRKADSMGNTPVSDSRLAYEQIPAGIREEFERKKLMYIRNYSDVDLPWTEVFQTDQRAEVEYYCRRHNIDFEWTGSGLRTKQISQATMRHPVTNEKLWFNQAHLFHVSNLDDEVRESLLELLGEDNLPRNACFGDGTPIDPAALSLIRNVYERTKWSFQWENNDLLLLDNMLYTHGREPFQGQRTVIVGMGRPYSYTAVEPVTNKS